MVYEAYFIILKLLACSLKEIYFLDILFIMNKRFYLFLLLFITLTAAILRTWNLSTNPAGFFVDEASHGREAYSILTTGKDTHGKPFPIIFKAANDYRDPVMIYSTIPFVALFGLNEFAVRLVSAVYGIGAVLMMYLVGKEYFNERIGLWSALLLAISPWHVHFSRVGFQLITSVFWLLFSLYFLHKSFKNVTYYSLAAVGLAITFFTYSTTKMYIPFIIVFHIFSYPKEWGSLIKAKLFWIISFMVPSLVIALAYPTIVDGTFFNRWNQVEKDMTLLEIGKAYINHFSPDFLFVNGDAQFEGQSVQRHSVHGVGELYWFQISFLWIAITAFFFSKIERMKILFFISFLYIYPLGSIFTSVTPQATRSILGVIPFTILTAYGIEETRRLFKTVLFNRLFNISLIACILISVFLFCIALLNYPLVSANYMGWQYGYRPAMEYLKQQENKYDHLFITHRFNMGNELLEFYNVEYKCHNCSVMNNPIKINQSKKELFVLRREDVTEAANLYPELQFIQQDSIKLPNGQVELVIGIFKPSDLFSEISLFSDDRKQ